MSELKAFEVSGKALFGRTYVKKVYLKSEADKVIAELKADYKEACGRLQTANLIKDEQLAATRHHKYKRCLAMAMWCGEKWADIATPYGKSVWYNKWQKRWLSLSNKFKESK